MTLINFVCLFIELLSGVAGVVVVVVVVGLLLNVQTLERIHKIAVKTEKLRNSSLAETRERGSATKMPTIFRKWVKNPPCKVAETDYSWQFSLVGFCNRCECNFRKEKGKQSTWTGFGNQKAQKGCRNRWKSKGFCNSNTPHFRK